MAEILQKYLQFLPQPEQLKGLLSPQQTQLQAGLLGAAQALQPYMGYTTTPTTFGQAAVGALTGAAGGIQQKEQSDLARALQGLNIYSSIRSATEPLSPIGKLKFDLKQGDITQTEFDEGVKEYYKTDNPATIQLIDYIAANRFGGKTEDAIDLLYSSKSESPDDWKRSYILESMTSDFAPKPGDDKYVEYKQQIEQEAESLVQTLYPKKESTKEYKIGETIEGADGKTYKKIGEDQWELVE